MQLSKIHHIAIIGSNFEKTKEFYVDKLGFKLLNKYVRPEKGDILFNVSQGDLTLEIFIKPDAPSRPKLPQRENQGLRHIAFAVEDVELCLEEFDHLHIEHELLRYDDFNQRRMAFFFDPDGLPLEIHEV